MARIVRISDMTDDEKEKWQEQVNKRNEELISNRQKEQERASQLFNEYISKNGAHDTTKHTTTIGNLKKAYKNYSNYDTVKNSLDKYYEDNKNQSNKKEDSNKEKDKQNELKNTTKIVLPSYNEQMPFYEAQNTTQNTISMTPAELERNNVPIVTKYDPRIALQRKKPWEYDATDYKNLAELNQVSQEKQAEMINELSKEHPVQAFGLNTIMNMTGGMAQSVFGINNAINTVGSAITKGIEKVAGFIGDEETEKKAKELYEKRVAEGSYINSAGNVIPGSNQYIDNNVIKTSGQISSTIGRQLMDAGIGGASGINGSTIQAIGVGGSSSQEVLDENSDNIVQSILTGTIKGTIAKKLEDLFDANILTKGGTKSSVQNEITKWIANTFKTNLGKKIASYISDVTGENVEEFLEDNIGMIVDKFVNGKDLPSFQEWLNNTGETAKITSLSTILMSLVGLGGNTYNDVQKLSLQNEKKNTTANLQQNSINNKTNLQGQEITQVKNNTVQNLNMEQIDDTLPVANEENRYRNIENNRQTLYNNNESESGINGKQQKEEQSRGNTNGIQTSTLGSQKENAFSIDRYKQEEATIRKQGEVNYTDNDKNFATKMQNKYNKKTFIFDDTNTSYGGGLSSIDNDTIMFGRNALNDYGYDFLEGHEILEDINKNHKEVSETTINKLKEKLQKDEGFGDVFLKYLADMEGDVYQYYIDKPELVAKEIIGDLNGLRNANIDYKTLENYKSLDSKLVQEIQDEILKLENKIYSKELSNSTKSSFSMSNEELAQAPSIANNTLPTSEYTKRKILNPNEISQIKKEDASSTPKLKNKSYEKGNRISSFYENITETSQFLNEDFRKTMQEEENIKYYKGITNEKTLEKAFDSLKEDGSNATINWATKDSKNATAEDVAKGWILLKQYQDNGDYQSAVEVAKKMRDIGTSAGQTVQAYNILSRLTPEGMFYYAQSELSEAYNKMVKGKSKKWIDENQSKFDLTPEETQFIMDTMEEISTMKDGYDKKVKLAEIQKVITDKIPSTAGQSIKAWMRISMLFNPKTQVRNVAGNATILPINMFSDSVSAGVDRLISKKTGIRTTGNTNLKSYGKGFKKGLYESYNDFKKGINTRNIQGNRFEVSEGRSFNNKGISKALNRVDSLLSFMLDAGDRGFYEATFTNSINNQLVLNNTTEVTQDMIDIATNEALQRTWQDNNAYTESVLKIRNILNKANIKGYGLGDVIIPFAKTPANLTKAIVDYSPAGLVNSITSGIRLKNSLETGQYTAQLQHQFVQNLGKATAGTFLYVLGYALAKAGIANGEADEDKDVKNFMKNSLGISSYSIKIGDKTFTYDWAQPIATPLAIMTNYVKYSEDNPNASVIDKAINAMNIGTEQLLQQSFMESLNTVLNGNGTTLENLSQAILELPARAIPTFSKQIADMVDGTQRTSFEYNKPIQSAINSVVAKIPFASKTLAPSVDTLGNEIQKYGGDNNLFNVFLNPANTNKGQLSKAGKEIYDVYIQTGDTTIFPRTAPYYINNKGDKVTMDSKQRSEFQKVSGQYVEKNLESIMNTSAYKNLSNDRKAEVINEVVSDSYDEAKDKVLNISSEEYKKEKEKRKGISNKTYYDYKIKSSDLKKDNEKIGVLTNANYSNQEKTALYENYILSSQDETYPLIKQFFTDKGLNINKYLEYKTQGFESDKKDDGTVNGKSISGSKKKKVYDYVADMKISYTQRLLLLGTQYKLEQNQRTTLFNYINSSSLKNSEKLELFGKIQGFTVYKDGTVKW